MSVVLKYLYDEIKKHKVKLLAGEKGLKNKVRWTQLAEGEEIVNFLQGEELIFTTGLGVRSREGLLNLVKKTHEMSASGIIIYTGKYIDNISEEIINYCNENDYPIFAVPWGTDMRDTMRYLSARIIESEKTYMEISNAIKDAIFLPNHKELFIPVFEKIGYRHDWYYNITIIEVESSNFDANKLNRDTTSVLSFMEEELNYIRSNFFAFNIGNQIIIIFNNITYEEIEEIVKKLYIKLMKEFMELEFYIGGDRKFCTLETFHEGYEESKKVLQINKLLSGKKVNLIYSDLDVYKLLLDMDNKENLKKFHNNILGKLEVYDEVNDTDYLNVLISYYKNNCKINETANALFIHRNTLNYKVNKIEEILDINLDDISDRCKIYLCIIIRHLL